MKTFLATWGLGYFRPGINQVGIEFFAEEAGYTAEDIGRIRELEEGQSIDFSENGIHSIVRLPDNVKLLIFFDSVPIKTDLVFSDEEGRLGELWAEVAKVENNLAEALSLFRQGTSAVLGEEAWFLSVEDGMRVLTHATVKDGIATEMSCRFDQDLMSVDVTESELEEYIERVKRANKEFYTIVLA